MIDTAVIPVAGLGTRLLTLTKDNPKEMVPIFTRSFNEITLKPLIEQIFLNLYDAGIRNFFFIVGKNKRSIEDHFTPERNNHGLKKKDKNFKDLLKDFYDKIEQSNIVWINQSSPRGFGAAVLNAKEIVGSKPFMVHAGDAFVRDNVNHIKNIIKIYDESDPEILFYVKEIKNPKSYGVVKVSKINTFHFNVLDIEEKPISPKSNFAVMPIYVFKPSIFDALSKTKPGVGKEIQLTDAIQKIIKNKKSVQAIKFQAKNDCIDIGTPENYYLAITVSYKDSIKKKS